MKKPYAEILSSDKKIRVFDPDSSIEEFVWHKDENHRYVKIISSSDWWLQIENSLPIRLIEGISYFIEADEWHRIIRGNGYLIVEIEEI